VLLRACLKTARVEQNREIDAQLSVRKLTRPKRWEPLMLWFPTKISACVLQWSNPAMGTTEVGTIYLSVASFSYSYNSPRPPFVKNTLRLGNRNVYHHNSLKEQTSGAARLSLNPYRVPGSSLATTKPLSNCKWSQNHVIKLRYCQVCGNTWRMSRSIWQS
jgi:hypothetical protein